MNLGIELIAVGAFNLVSLGVTVGIFVMGQRRNAEKIEELKDDIKEVKGDIKEDIGRLEKKQEESNKVKERLVITEESLKSAWCRIDEIRGYKHTK